MESLTGFMAVVLSLGMPVFIVLGLTFLKERTKQSAHKLIQQALDKGQPLDPKLMESLVNTVPQAQKPQDRARRTLGSAIVMLALAAGFVGASFYGDEWDGHGFPHGGIMMPAMILGALGLGFLLLAIVDYSTKKKTDE